MSLPKLNEVKEELKRQMEDNFNLLQTIHQISPLLSSHLINLVYEFSFLKIYLVWEWFIERAFILYMQGEKTDSGYITKCYVTPKDEKHAYEIIKGDRYYPDWLNLEFIREKSELVFEGGSPFKEALYNNTTIRGALQNMKTIRNAIVHISPKSKENYKNMLRNEFGTAPSITPGEFLQKDVPKFQNISYISYFRGILVKASDEIVK